MSSSRIFVGGLPPKITEEDFRAHFASRHAVTDIKLFSRRRFGYVGFRTAGEAASAVKYFHKSFIRMSRIVVELAEPVAPKLPKQQVNGEVQAQRKADVEHRNPLKRKRGEADPKLQEFLGLMQSPSKSKAWRDDAAAEKNIVGLATVQETAKVDGFETALANFNSQTGVQEEDVQPIDTKERAAANFPTKLEDNKNEVVRQSSPLQKELRIPSTDQTEPSQKEDATASDSDWLRSRTNRLLGLVDDDDEEMHELRAATEIRPADLSSTEILGKEEQDKSRATQAAERWRQSADNPAAISTINEPSEGPKVEAVRKSRRLFVRNLPYTIQGDDLAELFGPIGELQEVHVPLDSQKAAKGFAYVQFVEPDHAVTAFESLNGSIFHGRLLHILPATAKRETTLDEFAISKLPLKKQRQIYKKAEAATSTFNWNFMYMNPDAVIASTADKLGMSKSELLDPTSSEAAVRQAQAESHVIQQTKTYFEANGVDLNAFCKKQRSDTIILVKNFSYGTTAEELRKMFEEYGDLSRFLMPPSGTIAIVEFAQAAQALKAFTSLAYRKISSSVLFLERAPKDLFSGPTTSTKAVSVGVNPKSPSISASSLLQNDEESNSIETSTLFVKNLNFSTTSQRLRETFESLDGFVSARVKMKSESLSAGFGFLEFRSNDQAQAALRAMNGYNLEGHRLEMKPSHKGADAAEERRKDDQAKRKKVRKSKIIIKNLPFQASKKDIRSLFKSHGQLRAVRVPTKFDNTSKGYAFAEFTTPAEAENAMEALRHVHFLGRRLNMEFVAGDAEDPEKEIEKMLQKAGRQSNSMALQRLREQSGRKKFNAGGVNEETDEY